MESGKLVKYYIIKHVPTANGRQARQAFSAFWAPAGAKGDYRKVTGPDDVLFSKPLLCQSRSRSLALFGSKMELGGPCAARTINLPTTTIPKKARNFLDLPPNIDSALHSPLHSSQDRLILLHFTFIPVFCPQLSFCVLFPSTREDRSIQENLRAVPDTAATRPLQPIPLTHVFHPTRYRRLLSHDHKPTQKDCSRHYPLDHPQHQRAQQPNPLATYFS